MCQSDESSLGRTHPEPRKPSNFSASDVPACTHASISWERDGSTWRVTETVTGADMDPIVRREQAPGEARGDEIPDTPDPGSSCRVDCAGCKACPR